MPITPGVLGGMGAPARFSASPITPGAMGAREPRRRTFQALQPSPITPGVLGGGGVAPTFGSPIAPGSMGDTSFRQGLGNRFDAAAGAMSQPSPITPGVLGGGGVAPAPVSPISPGGMMGEPAPSWDPVFRGGGFGVQPPITPGTMGGMGAPARFSASPIMPGFTGWGQSRFQPQAPWLQQQQLMGMYGRGGGYPGSFNRGFRQPFGGSPITPGFMGGRYSPRSPITPGFMGGRYSPRSPITPGFMGG